MKAEHPEVIQLKAQRFSQFWLAIRFRKVLAPRSQEKEITGKELHEMGLAAQDVFGSLLRRGMISHFFYCQVMRDFL